MLKIKLLAAALLLVFSGIASAGLIPATWSDDYDPTNMKLSKGDKLEWTFDITGDGFTPLWDIVTNYGIGLKVKDDKDTRWWHSEWAYFDQPGLLGDKLFEVDFDLVSIGASLAGIFSLNLDGMLDVSLKVTKGDFWFKSAHLDAKGYSKEHKVPAPATLALFGLGLIGIAAVRRRKSV